ncbi:MAG: SAF domain-containing protein [Candidatus Omnitrophica bacterium]|nr:SAF domain-containing protein [Candidatus Omnitrophota bacterium]
MFTKENVKSIRPAYGLAPKYLNKILGKKVKTNIKKGIPLTLETIK